MSGTAKMSTAIKPTILHHFMEPISPPVIPGRRPPNFKVLGWLLIVIGLFLTLFMGWITHYMIGVVNATTAPGSLPH